jgi:ABC-type multidrug transport system permease subunit
MVTYLETESDDAEQELMELGEKIRTWLNACAGVVGTAATVLAILGIIQLTQPEGVLAGVIILGAAVVLGVATAVVAILARWIQTYSWVIARTSVASRKQCR